MYLRDYLKVEGMGIISCIHAILFVLMVSQVIHGSEIDLKLHSVIPPNITTDDVNFFTHTAFCVLIKADPPTAFEFMKVSKAQFPALNGQGVSYAILQFPSSSLNLSHRHPHAVELLFLLIGSLKVGFVDANDVLHTSWKVVYFPKGSCPLSVQRWEGLGFCDFQIQKRKCLNRTYSWSVEKITKSSKIDASNVEKTKASLIASRSIAD